MKYKSPATPRKKFKAAIKTIAENQEGLFSPKVATIQEQIKPIEVNLFSPADFARAIEPLESTQIKELCDRLCDFLFCGQDFAHGTRLTKLRPYTKLIETLPNLVEGKNAFYQTRQSGELWLRHFYFQYTGISSIDWNSINKKAAAKVVKKISNQAVGLDVARYEQCVSQLLQSEKIWEVGAGLIAASGRRPIEIIEVGKFQIEGDRLLFEGQAKKRGENFQAYSIPLVGCSPKLFIEKLERFRSSVEVQKFRRDSAGDMDLKKLSDPIRLQINRLGIIPALAWLPTDGSLPTCSDLRSAWVTICESKFKPEGKYSLLFRAELLGHALNVGSLPTLNYSRYAQPSCSEPSTSLVESAASASALNQSADFSLIALAKSLLQPEPCTPTTGPIPQSSQTFKGCESAPDSLTASLVVPLAKTSVAAENEPDSTAIDPGFGGKCSELSTMAAPILSDGRMLREQCLEELEKLLPVSEWSDIKSKAQSSYRQRNSERRTKETEFLLLPTPTTYPSGSKAGISPAGRNNLESKLRSLLPTPRANDGTQGYNSGKTGGINMTGVLKRDRLLMPGEAANPQIWGWMMGFPPNWCESVLMPDGLRVLADLDGGVSISPLPELASSAKILPGGENQSAIMEPPASQPKQSPSHSESNIWPLGSEVVCPKGKGVILEVGGNRLLVSGQDFEEWFDRADVQPSANPPRKIKAISLHQPWASLVAQGQKQHETRSWTTRHRGLIALHAAQKSHNCVASQFLRTGESAPLGVIVAIADLVDCVQMSAEFIAAQSEQERLVGDWEVGRFAWKLENIRPIVPIQTKGMQGLWNWEMPPVVEVVDGESVVPVAASAIGMVEVVLESDRSPIEVVSKSRLISEVASRHALDFYETPSWMTLLALANVPLSGTIGEVCSGHGAIANILKMARFDCWTNDIDPAKPADHHLDAADSTMWEEFPAADWIITNPPYGDLASPIMQAAYAHASKGIVMILRLDFLEGCDDRIDYFQSLPPTNVIVPPRFCFRKGKGGNWATDKSPTCLMIWDKSNTSKVTKILWFKKAEIPLFRRTPENPPSKAEIQEQIAQWKNRMANRKFDRIASKMQPFIEYNQQLENKDKWRINAIIVQQICKCSSSSAWEWCKANQARIEELNSGLSAVHNRYRKLVEWEAQ